MQRYAKYPQKQHALMIFFIKGCNSDDFFINLLQNIKFATL